MDWKGIIGAAVGRPDAIERVVRRARINDYAALATLLLLDEAPPAAAALVVTAKMASRSALLIAAALAPQIDAALAAWRADPSQADHAIGCETRRQLATGAAEMVGFLTHRPDALRAAVVQVIRSGDRWTARRCLDALGAAGWRALDDDLRAALLAHMNVDDLGQGWGTLDEAHQANAVRSAEPDPSVAAQLIGRIAPAAWQATNPTLRQRLIDAVLRSPSSIHLTASAWSGMTNDERAQLATSVLVHGCALDAYLLLDRLCADGSGALDDDLRAALMARATEDAVWRPPLRPPALCGADADRKAWTDGERSMAIAAAERSAWSASDLLRAVGATGWNAMRADERARLAAAVRRSPDALFRCPPALWRALAEGPLPSSTDRLADAVDHWRAEDADADLGDLPPTYQTLVLALARWRPDDATPDSVRLQRLLGAWSALAEDARDALVKAHPRVLSTVAAAARMHDVGDIAAIVARWASATADAETKRAVAAMLRSSAHWRAWMRAFAPSDADPPPVWEAWRHAARRGRVPDLAISARVARPDFQKRSRRRTSRRA